MTSIVDRAVQGAFADIEKNDPDSFAKLNADRAKKDELTKMARAAAEEQVKLAKELKGEPKDVAEILLKHLPRDRVEMIKSGLSIPTYTLDIAKQEDGHFWCSVTRDRKEFRPSIKLATVAGVDAATWLQYASIIVEAVLLVLQAVGIKVAISEQAITKTAEEVVQVVESSSALRKAVQNLVQVFEEGGSPWEKAKAIFYLIKDSYSAGILWQIIKGLCSNMSWWDWTKTAGIVTAMIIAALATDGAALIAKIVLALNSAYEFGKKIKNVVHLSDLKKNL